MNTAITPDTLLADLVYEWLQRLLADGRLEGTTINEYERVLRNLVIPSLGAVSVGELTTHRIDEVLVELGTQSLNRKRKAKVVMGAMLDTAVELGAIPINPIRGSLPISRPAPQVRPLTNAEFETVRTAVRVWLTKKRSGPKSSGDIADIIEVMAATGARMGRFSRSVGLT